RRVDLLNFTEHVLLPQTGRPRNGASRTCVYVHVDHQAQQPLGGALGKPNARLLKDVALAVARTGPDEAAALRAVSELPAAHRVSPRIERREARRPRLEAITIAPQRHQPASPEGAVVEPLAENDRLAHRKSSSTSLREKA